MTQIISKEFISYKNFGRLFSLIKEGGIVKIGDWGFRIKHSNRGYIELQLLHIGEELDNKILFDMSSSPPVRKKKTAKKVEEKKSTTKIAEVKVIEDEEMF